MDDYRSMARRVLPRMLYDFVDGGALDERTSARNREGFASWWLRGRSFRSSSEIDTSLTLLGTPCSMPVLTAPTGASGLLWPHGEEATAAAAASRGIIMEVSAGSLAPMEEIAAASSGPKWLQLFLYKDRGLTLEFLQRAKAAGYTAVCVTTDCPVHGRRERDERNGFTINQTLGLTTILDAAFHWRWWRRMAGSGRFSMRNFEGRATGGMSDMAAYIASVLDPSVGWDDLSWLRTNWDGPLVVKGICDPDDADEAIARGADAIQISNHGGRQLDGTLASIDALPGVAERVAGRVPVLLDGGVRRGTDVMKALALGATACVIGRSHLWGLAVNGQAGVEAVLDIIRAELVNAMTIGGWASLDALDHTAVRRL
ncbi:alpha-hydroxy-acid oxidizing protein [Acuticoccus sp. 2012]|uniref:Alpha-hydroxy-acid oxidizing protein n=1 Tax=Acuticoccus mangrovi TaxID=2796142 RepID=A0A934IHU1_9HYPH|nr:alpha-hydroxy-acid oxidizing protein [Acuticoccus mangrovi]